MPGILRKQQGGPCGWSRVIKRAGEMKLGTKTQDPITQGLRAMVRTLAFPLSEMAAWEGSKQGRDMS